MILTQQILGVKFFDGDAGGAVDAMCREGGLLVVPAAPALVNIQYDESYRRALIEADLAIADSGAMVLLWRVLKRRRITRISGLAYLTQLFERPELRESGATIFILPNNNAAAKASVWLEAKSFTVPRENFYIAPLYGTSTLNHQPVTIADQNLLDLVNTLHPTHIIVGLGGGAQEKLGLYLKENLDYRPAIHCIGAALGFLTGDQKPIPNWVDKFYLGWLLRLARNPSRYARRFWVAHELPGLIARFGAELPPMRVR